ncbi:MAG TPA: class I SAM-dependent methyltransferase [Actinomycetota bacterium]|nr:class I SAM-dependent methyltransferase [Actinomycetota bacterium]
MSRRRNHPHFARFYERLTPRCDDAWEGDLRAELCAPVTGRVLEIGAGNGPNFRHYREGVSVVAVEPEPTMIKLAEPRAREADATIRLVRGDALALPFPDGSFDVVVCSLVLCTIPDPDRALREIRRVVRPDGVVRLYEHVRSTDPTVAAIQDVVRWPWALFAGGCHPNRDTAAAVERAGFALHVRRFKPPFAGSWFVPHLIGEARPTAPARP